MLSSEMAFKPSHMNHSREDRVAVSSKTTMYNVISIYEVDFHTIIEFECMKKWSEMTHSPKYCEKYNKFKKSGRMK